MLRAWLATELPETTFDGINQGTFLLSLFQYPVAVFCLLGYVSLAVVGWRRAAFDGARRAPPGAGKRRRQSGTARRRAAAKMCQVRTTWLDPPPTVALLPVDELRLVEVSRPLTGAEQALTDRVWQEAVAANPTLFDGPVAACGGLGSDGEGVLVLRWVRATYRRYATRDLPGATCWLPHLFVSVLQPAEDGSLLVGRMAPWTASPGRWQLPSGTGEPPGTVGAPLTVAGLRALAARELREETGTVLEPERLALWRVSLNPRGDVGVFFRAPAQPAAVLRERHAALVADERARGVEPELATVAFVADTGDLEALPGGAAVGHLPALLAEYRAHTRAAR